MKNINKLDEFLEGVKARCEAATSGPWKAVGIGENEADRPIVQGGNSEIALCRANDRVTDDLNAIFIAHSRADVEALAKMVEILMSALAIAGRNSGGWVGLPPFLREKLETYMPDQGQK